MYIESYKQLMVWQRSMELSKEIYKATNKMPQHELYGLVSQMRRCAVSIPSNIAEGYKRSGLGEYVQFLSIADASAAELETQLLLTKDLYPNIDLISSENLLLEVQKMLIVMIKKLKDKKSLNAKRSTLDATKGQVLIEAMVAMSVATVGLLGAFTLLSFSLRMNRDINDKFIAISLATEGIEIVKNLIRHNVIITYPWNDGNCLAEGSHEVDRSDDKDSPRCSNLNEYLGNYLKFEPNSGIYGYDNGSNSKYRRKIAIAWYCLGIPCSPSDTVNEIKVNSIVSWTGSGNANYEVNLEDHFFNWLTQCNDGIDNDGQQGIDLIDPDCSTPNDNSES